MDFRIFRRLIFGINSGEVFNFASARPLIQTFNIALFGDLKRCIDKDLNEDTLARSATHHLALGAIRTDEGTHDNEARIIH